MRVENTVGGRYLGRVEDEVVDPATARVDPAVLHPLDDRLEGDAEVDHHVDRGLRLQSLGLGLSPGGRIYQSEGGRRGLMVRYFARAFWGLYGRPSDEVSPDLCRGE